MVLEAVGDEVLERLQEQRSEDFALFLIHGENVLGRLQRFVPLRVANFGEDEAGDGGGVEADFDGHGGAHSRGKRPDATR